MKRSEALALGLKIFTGGKPCLHGHTEGRRVDNYLCVVCNREKINAYAKGERGRAVRQAWLASNPESGRQHQKTYRERNADRISAQRRGRPKSETERSREQAYRKAQPWRFRAYAAERQTRMQLASCAAFKGEVRQFYKDCPEGLTVDHVVPLRGKLVCGWHHPNNLSYLTPEENSAKGNRFDPERWPAQGQLAPQTT